MSAVAEYAARLHEQAGPRPAREYEPVHCDALSSSLHDIRAVIFDVYGTLIDYRKDAFGSPEARERSLLEAFEAVIAAFGVEEYLRAMAPTARPSRTLSDFYNGLIAMEHQKLRQDQVQTPEVQIDRIWGLILLMLKRRGWDPSKLGLGDDTDVARCMAYHYNFCALGRGFYPGVVDALSALVAANIRLGVVSNAQFYTPIDLTLFARDQSGGRCEDYLELLDTDLIFYSYEYGIAKPGAFMFEKLFNALYEMQILPSQTVFVGNDLAADIEPAQRIGLRTAFFRGDRRSAFMGESAGKIVPDISFASFGELPHMVNFHGGTTAS
jgi:putative hydrolase of the HAD superfamily